jgi:predicted cobalt transporter CbtA
MSDKGTNPLESVFRRLLERYRYAGLAVILLGMLGLATSIEAMSAKDSNQQLLFGIVAISSLSTAVVIYLIVERLDKKR